MENNKTELLSPAGSVETLHKVIAAGADAVYIGSSRFGARAYADNPDEAELLEAIDYAHLRNVRVYLTVNTLFKESELEELTDYLRPYVERGIDAVLVQDFGALRILSRSFPALTLHASTQMTVTGPEAALLLKDYGVARVVPARELSLKELKRIHDVSGLEVEAFIHGALCYSLSGQCLMSSVIGGRSGNRGRCAQPCRLSYSCQKRKGTLLSLKDLCTLERIPEMIRSGVISFKIEGRMKKSGYAAGVTAIYRKYLDLYLADPSSYKVDKKDIELLSRLFSREGFTDAYLDDRKGSFMLAPNGELRPGRHDEALYEQNDRLYSQDKKLPVEGRAIIKPGQESRLIIDGQNIRVEVKGEPGLVPEGSPMPEERIRKQLMKTGNTAFYFKKLDMEMPDKVFMPVSAQNALRREAFSAYEKALLDAARRKAASSRTEGHLPEKRVGDFRTEKPDENTTILTASFENEAQYRCLLKSDQVGRLYYPLGLLLSRPGSLIEKIKRIRQETKENGKEIYLALPYLERNSGQVNVSVSVEQAEDMIIPAGWDGIMVRSPEGFARLVRKGMASYVITDASLYSWNSESAAFYLENGVDQLTLPFELNKGELHDRSKAIRRKNLNLREEMVVYGRIPLMISWQCLRKNTEGCVKKTGFFPMTDRTGRSFPVKNDCEFCYNVIENSVPLSLIGDMHYISESHLSSLRLIFTDETENDIRSLTEAFGQCLTADSDGIKNEKMTRVHFKRGVL